MTLLIVKISVPVVLNLNNFLIFHQIENFLKCHLDSEAEACTIVRAYHWTFNRLTELFGTLKSILSLKKSLTSENNADVLHSNTAFNVKRSKSGSELDKPSCFHQ